MEQNLIKNLIKDLKLEKEENKEIIGDSVKDNDFDEISYLCFVNDHLDYMINRLEVELTGHKN